MFKAKHGRFFPCFQLFRAVLEAMNHVLVERHSSSLLGAIQCTKSV